MEVVQPAADPGSPVESWIDRQHRLRLRAERVAALLVQLWGDRPPPSPNPQLTTLIDAMAGDDEHGRDDQLVVHGDNLTYRQLARALQHRGSDAQALTELPTDLARRLATSGLLSQTPVSIGMAALPAAECGAWELDTATGTIAYDAVAARILGAGHTSGRGLLPANTGDGVHPDDRPVVAAALAESVRTGRPYEVRFRTLQPDGTYTWCASRARVLTGPGAPRLVGFVAADE